MTMTILAYGKVNSLVAIFRASLTKRARPDLQLGDKRRGSQTWPGQTRQPKTESESEPEPGPEQEPQTCAADSQRALSHSTCWQLTHVTQALTLTQTGHDNDNDEAEDVDSPPLHCCSCRCHCHCHCPCPASAIGLGMQK